MASRSAGTILPAALADEGSGASSTAGGLIAEHAALADWKAGPSVTLRLLLLRDLRVEMSADHPVSDNGKSPPVLIG